MVLVSDAHLTGAKPVLRRLWPSPDAAPLDDEQLLAAYPMPEGHPLVRVNFVSSVDGSVTLDGRSGGLGDAADRRVFGLLRVGCDALLVAAGTVRIEGYGPLALSERLRRLRRAQGRAADPVLVLVTRRLDLDPTDPLFTEAPHRPAVVTTETTARRAGDRFGPVADIVGMGADEVDLAAAMAELTKRGLPHVLCEGGPHLLGSLLEADLVDELCLTVAPKLVGAGPGRIVAGPPSPVRNVALAQVLASDDELFLRYTRAAR
jgi:riboflavin biosynthesis pyrimidine reductase